MRRSRLVIGRRGSAARRATTDTEHCCAEVSGQATEERTVEVGEAEDAATTHARASFEQVDAAPALIAIGRELRIAEDAKFRHRRYRVRGV